MAEHHILVIEHPARLKIDTGRLRIERDEHPPAFVLPEDIDVLCLHHPVINLSVSALQTLAEAGAVVILTDARHQPSAQLHPLKSHARQSQRLRRQIRMEASDQPPRLWCQIIRARIRSEAATLRALGRKGALYLERLSQRVEPGDAGHLEGQAARHYWKHLFEGRFRREKQGADDDINSRLNFGYAVLRAVIARQLACMGLNLGLGLGHRSSENPFNLADDFIEPYRYLVECHVAAMGEETLEQPLNGKGKQELLAFITHQVPMNDGEYRLNGAVEATVDSFCRILDGRADTLALPAF
ncbi:MAG TPA: type II CRISPR-associated endonuclease Cas1 [Devosia sp.]|nr:type II CRISPR-associated endonuclease Cas1 [Devosia sp.]